MYIGVLELTLRLDGCRSLKDKRQVVRSLVDQLRHHGRAAVAEVAYQDEHELAGIGVAVVSGDRRMVEQMLADLIDFAEDHAKAEIVGIDTDIL